MKHKHKLTSLLILSFLSCRDSGIDPISPKSYMVAYARYNSTWIYLVSISGGPSVPIIQTNEGKYFTWSRDGTSLIYVEKQPSTSIESSMVRSFFLESRSSVPLFAETGAFVGPMATSSSTGMIAYRYVPLQNDSQQVLLRSFDGSGRLPLTNSYSFKAGPVWSPLGDILAFQDAIGLQTAILSVKPDGSMLTPLTSPPERATEPTFSADGTVIAYRSYSDGRISISSVNSNGSDKRAITVIDSSDRGDPTWSPTGEYIAFYQRDYPSKQFIYIIRPDGTGLARVSDEQNANHLMPAWTPSGNQIVFVSNTNFGELFIVDATGNKQKQLTFATNTSEGGISVFKISPNPISVSGLTGR